MSAKKKVFAVSALTLGGIAGATGTAYAAQGGITTEAPSGTTTTVAEPSQSSKSDESKAKPASTKERSSAAAQSTAPAPTISQAEKSEPRASTGGGQGGVSTELPSDRKAESAAAEESSQSTDAPTRPQAHTSASAQSQSAPAAELQATDATVQQASHVAPVQNTAPATPVQNTAPATPVQNTAPATPVQNTAPATPVQDVAAPAAGQAAADYADTAAVSDDENQGQGGVVTELPDPVTTPDSETADGAQTESGVVEAPADDTRTDYSERVEAASQTPASGAYTPAAPAEPTGQVATYAEPRQNGGEAGIVGNTVATGTAVEVNDTTSYVSNTTTGGGEQATAAQAWDASNGDYNATWATTGGVSGTGGFSATNEQTAPNVGTAGVDGQWASADGASSVSVTGGATLENYGVHDASGSIEISTPVGNMAFSF